MKKIGFYIALLFLVACAADPEPKPEGMLSEDKFVEVFADVQLLEATYKQKIIREDDPTAIMPKYYQQIFAKHEVTEEEFKTTFNWWMDHPQEMLEIYNRVIDLLTKLEKDHADQNKE